MLFKRKQPLLSNVSFIPSILRKQLKTINSLAEEEADAINGKGSDSLEVPNCPIWKDKNVISTYLADREKWLNSWKMCVTQANTFKMLYDLQSELLSWELHYQRGISDFFHDLLHNVEAANSRDALDYQRWKELLPDSIWNGSWEDMLNWPGLLESEDGQRIIAEAGRCAKLIEIYQREKTI